MKPVIAILIIVAALFLGWKLLDYWDQTTQEREAKRNAATVQVDPRSLAGVPYQLEGPLEERYRGRVETCEDGRQWHIDERPADEVIDLIQPIPRHRDAHGHRNEQ